MKDADFLSEMRERYRLASEADSDLRERALDDMRFAFVPGNQWDERAKKARRNRPCYEFNRIRQHIKQVTGDQRKNRPQIKVRAVEEGDKKTADTFQGLIRNIENVSNAERAYDTGFEWAVGGGFGAWRVTTRYCSDDAFDQEIAILEIRNPHGVFFDPAAKEWDRRDSMFAFIPDWISEDEYEKRWPAKEVSDWEGFKDAAWKTEGKVLICEYWVKIPIKREVVLLSDGKTVWADEIEKISDELAAAGVTEVKRRKVDTHKIEQNICSGIGRLEPPTAWAGKFIPLVPVWGDLVMIDGEDHYSGMVRFSRDGQKLYNFDRTMAAESVGKSPKAPYMATAEQIKGYEQMWGAANAEDFPYLLYNVDPIAPGLKPQREPGPEVPASMIALLQLDSEDLKATTGQFDASLGRQGNETSGRAIIARQQEGDTATFEYVDNLSRSIRYTGEILVDLIPKIYDTRRQIRILGADNSEQYVTLNDEVVDQQTGETVKVNDLSRGRYDVTVTTGPSYATAQMELADTLLKVAQTDPTITPIISDLVVKSLDLPGSDEAIKRLRRRMIQQGIVSPTPEDKEEEQKNPPPPNPQAELQMRSAQAEVQAKEIANAQAMKELQTQPQQDMAPQIAGAQLQLEHQKLGMQAQQAQIEAQSKIEVERLRIQYQQWEAELKAQTDIERARIESDTKFRIAEMQEANKAQIANDGHTVKLISEANSLAL